MMYLEVSLFKHDLLLGILFMITKILPSLLLLGLSLSSEAKILQLPPDVGNNVIYGKDDRHEIDNYDDSDFIKKSQSVGIRIYKKRLSEDRDNPERILFPNITLRSSITNLCPTERYLDQRNPGDCSGFLVGPRTLVTAGHCMMEESECTDFKWVFGFKKGVEAFSKKQVYSCKKIMTQKLEYTEKEVSDYAVIELDRDVEGYVPLKMRKFGMPLVYTPLVVIGHPLGLPMKATDGGVVSFMNADELETPFKSLVKRTDYFTANLDAYAGNSGAPVFNKITGKVEGILIQGAEDFVYNSEKGCLESMKYSNSHRNTYEKVMRITKVPGINK